MIWDLGMIREVRCARASVDIMAELIVLPPEREAEVEAVLREAHRRPNFGQATLAAWWEPATDAVVLVGGANDGHHIRWRGAPEESVRVPVIGPVVVEEIGAGPPTGPPPELPVRTATYSMTGWNESGWWRYGLEKQ